jgi:hypothetical protein
LLHRPDRCDLDDGSSCLCRSLSLSILHHQLNIPIARTTWINSNLKSLKDYLSNYKEASEICNYFQKKVGLRCFYILLFSQSKLYTAVNVQGKDHRNLKNLLYGLAIKTSLSIIIINAILFI